MRSIHLNYILGEQVIHLSLFTLFRVGQFLNYLVYHVGSSYCQSVIQVLHL